MDEFIIWAAGLFDGEGSVSINRPAYGLVVGIANSYRSALELFKQRYAGYINPITKRGQDIFHDKYKARVTCYQFIFTWDSAKAFLMAVLPYLRIKKLEAELALDYISTITNLASLRGGRRAGIKMTGLERGARFEFFKKLKAIREGSSLLPLTDPLVTPQLPLFSEN